MQVHESCGHPTELDRAFGTEASYAGTSFLTPGHAGHLPLRLATCATSSPTPRSRAAWARFGWDDEGVAAQQVPLIKEGIFVGYLSSRETAPRIGRASAAARCGPTAGTGSR